MSLDVNQLPIKNIFHILIIAYSTDVHLDCSAALSLGCHDNRHNVSASPNAAATSWLGSSLVGDSDSALLKAFSYLVIYPLLHLASPTYTRPTWGKIIRSSGHADSTVLEYRKRNQGPSILRPLRQLNCNPFEEEWKMWLNGWFNQKRCRIN